MTEKASNPKSSGRPQPQIVQDNFNRVEKLDNKTNRYKIECIHCGSTMVNRDNNHIKHLASTSTCPKVPASVRQSALLLMASKNPAGAVCIEPIGAGPACSADSEGVQEGPSKKCKAGGTLGGFVDYALTETQTTKANVKLLRALVHGNVSFLFAEDWYFRDFLRELRPLYQSPSRHILSHSILDMEAAQVKVEEEARLKSSSHLTLLIDGWEDLLKRSLYGFVAAEVGKFPVVLSLENMTGERATGKAVAEAGIKSLASMGITEANAMNHVMAATTDNPSVMIVTRKTLQHTFWWILVRK